MAYTTIDKPTDYFNTVLYSGNSGTQSITGVGFQPDWTWVKRRNGVTSHGLTDSVRGAGLTLFSDTTQVEQNYSAYFTSFDSDGFSLAIGGNVYNASGSNYVAWNWLGGGTASSNTDGSITSSVSANTTAGFSIGTYTGNSTSGATVGHSLSDTPDCIIVRTTSGTDSWQVYHQALGNTSRLELNNTDAKGTSTALWNNTSPTSSVFSLGNGSVVNSSTRDYVFYAFAEKKGYAKFGSYTGNGSTDGAFVYTGFKPAWVMYKVTSTTNSWVIQDTKRSTTNVIDDYLLAEKSNAEATSSALNIDFLSNGFKHRNSSSASNASGSTYIYMAFAENPFTTSTGIPTTAR